MGISEAIVHSVESLPESKMQMKIIFFFLFKFIQRIYLDLRSDLYENIVLMGGNAKFKGFNQRVYDDVRCLISSKYKLNVTTETDCVACAWQGGKLLAENETEFQELLVSKKTYEELGHSVCKKKFDLV